jgi:PAS domain S-box-containing protein
MGNHEYRKSADTEVHRAEVRDTATLERMTAAWQEANDAYRESERRYRELVESSLGLICTHDLDGGILSINPAAATSLGYRPEDGIGRNLREFLAPDKRNLFDDYLRRIRHHGQDAGLMSVVARTGETRVWMYRNVLSQGPHGISYVLGHAIDITERVAAERNLRQREHALRLAHSELESRVRERTADLERANERLRVEIAEREEAEHDRETALIEQRDTLAFLGNVSERLAPLITLEQLVEVSCQLPVPFLADWTIVHTVDADQSIRCLKMAHAGALPEDLFPSEVSVSEHRSISHLDRVIGTGRVSVFDVSQPAGRRNVYPAVTAAALKNAGANSLAMIPFVVAGRVKSVLSLFARGEGRYSGPRSLVVDDVARRIGLALDRIQLYREAQEANRLKDEFLSTLSHELRTPLNAIFGWARILRTRQLDDRTAHGLEVIQRNADAQIRLIEEVLDVSRIIAGKMTITMEAVDLAAILRATIDTVRLSMDAKRIRFQPHIETVPVIAGDSQRLQQVFSNLLSNAIKFTRSEGTISVTLRQAAGGIEFEIADTGVGIRREVLPFVFDRFRQADSSTTRMYGGLGLGLAIVRHIVELHG